MNRPITIGAASSLCLLYTERWAVAAVCFPVDVTKALMSCGGRGDHVVLTAADAKDPHLPSTGWCLADGEAKEMMQGQIVFQLAPSVFLDSFHHGWRSILDPRWGGPGWRTLARQYKPYAVYTVYGKPKSSGVVLPLTPRNLYALFPLWCWRNLHNILLCWYRKHNVVESW